MKHVFSKKRAYLLLIAVAANLGVASAEDFESGGIHYTTTTTDGSPSATVIKYLKVLRSISQSPCFRCLPDQNHIRIV